MIAKPKQADFISVCEEYNGVYCSIELRPNQKWKVRKQKNHFILTRKGTGITLRLTGRIFNECFEVRENE